MDAFLANVNREIVNPLIELLFALAIIYFLYGLVVFINGQANEETRTEGKMHMIYGVIGIAIMLGVWGILNMVLKTFHISKSEVDPEMGTVNLPPYNPTIPPIGPTP